MKFKLLFIIILLISIVFIYPVDIYYGPGLQFPTYEKAFEAAQTGDHLIDCTETDMKILKGNHWNWVSYPRLNRTGNNSVDVVPLLEDFLSWPFYTTMQFEASTVLTYNLFYWNPTSYQVTSTKAYKLAPDDTGHHYLPSQNGASRLPANWTLEYTLPENTDNWMGYWLPYTQNIVDAFGDFWDDVVSIEAEDWYYKRSSTGINNSSSDPSGKNMVYGKSYVVTFDVRIRDFYWTDTVNVAEEQEKLLSQSFSFNDLPDYEVIDVMDIPENVLEIGVFEEDVCVGAVVVQDTCEQILVYSTSASRDQIPFSFEIITNTRGYGEPITKYQVMNEVTGFYENRSLISGQQKSSIIMFGNLGDPQNNTPSIDNVTLHGNYPNPFNPETNISFSLPHEQNIELVVYNMKGQKVRQLINGQFSAGEQTIIWNGKDDNGKSVGSGLYLYKLKTIDQEISKKMLLLK